VSTLRLTDMSFRVESVRLPGALNADTEATKMRQTTRRELNMANNVDVILL
jgi:hypothetical protein